MQLSGIRRRQMFRGSAQLEALTQLVYRLGLTAVVNR